MKRISHNETLCVSYKYIYEDYTEATHHAEVMINDGYRLTGKKLCNGKPQYTYVKYKPYADDPYDY